MKPLQTEAETACPRVVLAADHGGVRLKDVLVRWLSEHGYQARDLGTLGEESVDYPDYAEDLVRQMTAGHFERGVLICKTGIGMSIAANRLPGIRAALVADLATAVTSRTHNDANILVLSGRAFDERRFGEAREILEKWLVTPFEGGRHQRRLSKIEKLHSGVWNRIGAVDPEIAQILLGELERERRTIELIASENFASRAVMEAQGFVFTNKYAEGYPGKRWYGGCEFMDKAESLAIERARRLFGGDHVNVQPHSGSSANMAVYFAMLNPGDTILAMNLAHGGHLTHGHELNFSGRFFKIVPYGVSRETEQIDYDALAEQARAAQPRMILAGASAYSRIIDFPRLRQIADDVGALLVVDMAHIAGLVAAGEHPSPVPYCDVVTSTTHKTLRGPRGGLIICREAHAKAIDMQVFPGVQGGPLMHVIAAKAVCFHEALQPGFRVYQQQIRANARQLAGALQGEGVRVVSGGTDNHCFLIDLTSVSADLSGRDLSARLDAASITVNKNAIPFDRRGPFHASGIRIGTPAVTTRGMKEPQMSLIAGWIAAVARAPQDDALLERVRGEVHELTAQYPLYPDRG